MLQVQSYKFKVKCYKLKVYFSGDKTMFFESKVVPPSPSERHWFGSAENRPLSHLEIWWCQEKAVLLQAENFLTLNF